jgi:hypothetical protein
MTGSDLPTSVQTPAARDKTKPTARPSIINTIRTVGHRFLSRNTHAGHAPTTDSRQSALNPNHSVNVDRTESMPTATPSSNSRAANILDKTRQTIGKVFSKS